MIRSGDLIVTSVVNDYILAKAYMNMAEEGTLSTVFFQGVPSLSQFLSEFMTEGKRVTLGCFSQPEGEAPELCGLGWVYSVEKMGTYRRAETGMCFFRRVKNRTSNVAFGRLMFESFFQRYEIDALFGLTAEPNKLALRYAQRLGMWLSSPVPDYCYWKGQMVPGIISHISRAQWLERNA